MTTPTSPHRPGAVNEGADYVGYFDLGGDYGIISSATQEVTGRFAFIGNATATNQQNTNSEQSAPYYLGYGPASCVAAVADIAGSKERFAVNENKLARLAEELGLMDWMEWVDEFGADMVAAVLGQVDLDTLPFLGGEA
jgi:hypothetical protein